MTRQIIGVGRVLLWSGGSLWIGRGTGQVQPHAHHAIQISLGLTGRLRLRGGGKDEAWSDHAGAVVLPHHRHQFDGAGETVANVFVEPETAQGRALLARHAHAPIADLPGAFIGPLAAPLGKAFADSRPDEVLIEMSRHLIAALSGEDPAGTGVDPRIARAIAFVRNRLGGPVTLAEAAAAVHLSPSRFRHLFVAQTGISFRAYLLWARIATAAGAAMGGLSWTEAAHRCGFADSAHLSRTCRRMFGLAPFMLQRG